MKKLIKQLGIERKMKRVIKQFRYDQKGFTLIELLVVVAILGVLAGVVVPNVSKFMGSGKTEAANTEVANVRLAVSAFLYDGGTITAVTSRTNVIATLGLTAYLQGTTTEFWYTLAADGIVTQFLTAS